LRLYFCENSVAEGRPRLLFCQINQGWRVDFFRHLLECLARSSLEPIQKFNSFGREGRLSQHTRQRSPLSFARITAVMNGIQPHLTTHGFVLFHTMRDGGANSARMETVLMHKSGEYISSTIEVPTAKPNDPQAYGSAMTCGSRYSIMALLGLVTDDDDAKSATITIEDRPRAIFDCQNLDDLSTAAFDNDNKLGQSKVEKMAIRASLKAMKELLAAKIQEVA
jgi:ERF superfamily